MAFTFFFRDMQALTTAIDLMVPAVLGRRRIAIWDAGCATGQEAYSLAVLLYEKLGAFQFRNVHIDATDLDPNDTFSAVVTNARYDMADLGRIPQPLLDRHFIMHEGGSATLHPEIARAVSFRKHDLRRDSALGDGDYDLVVCKNVLLHLSREERVIAVAKFAESLRPSGLLTFENTQNLPAACTDSYERVGAANQIYRRIHRDAANQCVVTAKDNSRIGVIHPC